MASITQPGSNDSREVDLSSNSTRHACNIACDIVMSYLLQESYVYLPNMHYTPISIVAVVCISPVTKTHIVSTNDMCSVEEALDCRSSRLHI